LSELTPHGLHDILHTGQSATWRTPLKIVDVAAAHVRVPLDVPYAISRGVITAFDSIIVKISTDQDVVGYGETVPLSATGDPRALLGIINEKFKKSLVGEDPGDIEAIITRLTAQSPENIDAIGGVDGALWDILGKSLNVPVFKLLGGLCQPDIPVDYTLGNGTPEAMAARALEVTSGGFRGVVVKVTCDSVPLDIECVRTVRKALPAASTVRVDCNGGYTRETAKEFLTGINELDIELVEQPVPRRDFEGMKICRQYGVPICADESLDTSKDALDLVRMEAVDFLNIKIPKVGGLLHAKRIAAIGEAAGIPLVVGGRTTLGLSRFASQHFAASTPGSIGRCHEGPGPASQALSDDVISPRLELADVKRGNGTMRVSASPGMGYEIVAEKVERYAVA
jgi:L-alanine-DL-glutamate epimerase-like enolase superfamily enzyme